MLGPNPQPQEPINLQAFQRMREIDAAPERPRPLPVSWHGPLDDIDARLDLQPSGLPDARFPAYPWWLYAALGVVVTAGYAFCSLHAFGVLS